MRYLLGIPVPDTLDELRTMVPGTVAAAVDRLPPPMRRQVVAAVRQELETLDRLAERRGEAAARREALTRLQALGIRVPPGEAEEVYTRALPILRAIAALHP